MVVDISVEALVIAVGSDMRIGALADVLVKVITSVVVVRVGII